MIGSVHRDRNAGGQRRRALVQEGVVERLLQAVVLQPRLAPPDGVRDVGLGEHGGEVQPGGLPVRDRRLGVEQVDPPDGLVERAQAERREQLAHLLGDVLEERLDELGLAAELGPQRRVLGRDPDGAGVEVADAHHDAARDHERRRGEAVLLRAEQRPDQHVAARLELPVHLDHDAVPQSVDQQRLLGLGQPDLPRDAGVLERGQRRRAGAAVVARDQHDVGVRLGHAGRHRADADLGHELDVHPRLGVGRLEVVDQLRDVLNGVDVVVRRRRDQTHAGRRVPRPRDPRVDLVARQLAALTRLGALGDLDLQVVRVDEVLARHAEAARGDLLDRAAAQVAVGVGRVAVGVLAALAGVGAPADAVHGDGERLVRLGRDGAVRHRPGREARHDLPTGSTSSSGIGPPGPGRSRSNPRSVPSFSAWSSTRPVYSLKIS